MKRICCLATALIIITGSAGAADFEAVKQEIGIGRSLLRTEQHDKGVALLSSAVTNLQVICSQNPTNIPAFYELGMSAFYIERDEVALKAFNRITELDPQDDGPYFFKGLIYRYSGQKEKSKAAFLRACELDPKGVRNWYELGVHYTGVRETDEAVHAFRKAIELNPKHMQAIYKLAMSYIASNQQTKAVPLLEQVTQAAPDDINAFYNLGQTCQNLGQTEKALNAFEQVVKLEPRDWQALAKTVQLNQALGRTEQRDKQREAIFKLRKTGVIKSLNEEPLYCRDQFSAGGEKVMAFEYFELKGEMAVRYSFNILDETGQNQKFRISLGSYDMTNAISREQGELAEGERLFHLDGYYPGGMHRTFGFFDDGEPDYDTVKKMVIEILEGDRSSISSSAPAPAEDQKEENAEPTD